MLKNSSLYTILYRILGEDIEQYYHDYNYRLIVQKLIYLLHEKTISKNSISLYNYHWYVAGPYSSQLTNQMYNGLSQLSSDEKEKLKHMQFSQDGVQIIDYLTRALSWGDTVGLNQADGLELLASLLFLKKNRVGSTEGELARFLVESKPKFAEHDEAIGKALRFLGENAA